MDRKALLIGISFAQAHAFTTGCAKVVNHVNESSQNGKAIFGIHVGRMSMCFLGIKGGFHPIFACFNLIRRVHSQLIDCSTPFRRSTQQLKSFSVEIKMLAPRILARVE
jgi:hypothetical protein